MTDATVHTAQPARWQDYVQLLKPRVMSLVVFTGFAGLMLAPKLPHPLLAAVAVLCIAVAAGAAVPVDAGVVRDALGRQRFFQEAAERTAVPGVATGLAVTGTGGDVLFVEATAISSSFASRRSSSRRSSAR